MLSLTEPAPVSITVEPKTASPPAPISTPKRTSDKVLTFPSKPKRGRKKKSGAETMRIDYVKASKNTWAFRIRWTEEDGRSPAIYISRVSDQLFNMITKRKTRYAAFKKQLISSYLSRTIREGHGTDAGSNRAL